MRFRLLTAALLLLTTSVPAVAQAGPRPGPTIEPGAAAAPGRWTVRSGCAARTGVSRSAPLREAPRKAWTYTARGTIESEPLVWDDLVVVTTRDSAHRRTLHLVDAGTGRRLSQQAIPSSVPLEPTLWGNHIAIRAASDRIDVFRIAVGNRLQAVRTIRAENGSVSAPLFHEGDLLLRNGGFFERYELGRREPLWRVRPKGRFVGTPSARGDWVFGMFYDRRNIAHLTSIDAESGQRLDELVIGHHGGEAPPEDAQAEVMVFAQDVFVKFPMGVESKRGLEYRYGRVPRRGPHFDDEIGTALHPLGVDPLPLGDSWVVLMKTSEGANWIFPTSREERDRVVVLADEGHHEELLSSPLAPSRMGPLILFGPLAVDPEGFQVLWRNPVKPRFRAVPTADAVLVVEGDTKLIALRAPPRTRGRVEVAAEGTLADIDEQLAQGYADLALKAVRTNSIALCRRLIAEAQQRQASGRALESAQQGLEQLNAAKRAPIPDPRKSAAVEKEERALLDMPRRKLLELATASTDRAWQRALLRALLTRVPGDPDAIRIVRRLVPVEAPQGKSFDALSWLDFLDAHERTPVRFIERPPGRKPGVTPEEKILAEETRKWRPDLAGYRSERLFLVTPPERPGAVARSLALGELVCDALEEIFQPLGRTRGSREPLTLFLYETQEEYIDQSRRESSAPELAHGWTAGHYSTGEQLSRMFVPTDDGELRELLGVYAHELTHHWLDTRAPLAGRRRNSPNTPGYWIAEGFATMVEEFRFDLEAHSWSPHNPRAESLDTVANAAPDQLLAWDVVLNHSHAEFTELSPEPDATIPLTWRLGVRKQQSDLHLFYAQAGALSHYLFNAEDGAQREKLLAFTAAWTKGDRKALDPQQAFGMTPRELGERVVAYAKATVGGS